MIRESGFDPRPGLDQQPIVWSEPTQVHAVLLGRLSERDQYHLGGCHTLDGISQQVDTGTGESVLGLDGPHKGGAGTGSDHVPKIGCPGG